MKSLWFIVNNRYKIFIPARITKIIDLFFGRYIIFKKVIISILNTIAFCIIGMNISHRVFIRNTLRSLNIYKLYIMFFKVVPIFLIKFVVMRYINPNRCRT